MISRIIRFLDSGVWEIPLGGLPPFRAFLVKALRTVLLASRRFIKGGRQNAAAVLTYYSLLNFVPVLAVAFAVAKGFGLEKLVEGQIAHIAQEADWQADTTSQLLTFSHRLLDHAKGGLIAGVGVVLLFWTVISILGKIEGTLNVIWEIKKSRSLVRKFSDYLAILLLAPILFVISGSATILVAGHVKAILSALPILALFSKTVLFLLSLLPYVSIWVLLTAVYLAMPSVAIPVRSALLGAVTAGTIAQIVQWVYVKFQIGVASYGAIYGSFAALPLFLGWLQMSWMIVLFGAEIAYASEHCETYGFHPDYSRISVALKRLLMLRVFHLLVKKFSVGEKPMTTKRIALDLQIPATLVERLLDELAQVGLASEVAKGKGQEAAFQPAKTIENMTLLSVVQEYEKNGISTVSGQEAGDAAEISRYLREISAIVVNLPANVRLKEI